MNGSLIEIHWLAGADRPLIKTMLWPAVPRAGEKVDVADGFDLTVYDVWHTLATDSVNPVGIVVEIRETEIADDGDEVFLEELSDEMREALRGIGFEPLYRDQR